VVTSEHEYPQPRFAGRGIVICAGGARMVTCAWVLINVLRRLLQCTLPIQIWHIGPRELGPVEAGLFASLAKVEVVDAAVVRETWPARRLGGWELKAYSLVHTRFEQVLLLDADNVPVADPAALFERPELAQTGTLAWPDIERLRSENQIWELCDLDYQDVPAWESGQLVIDKSRCWHALQIALHMNMHSELFYPLTDGDADTFHLGWRLAGTRWSMSPYPARPTVTGLYQRDFDGNLLFQHRTTAKWRLSGENLTSGDFRLEAECLGFIDELRDRWSGQVDALPPLREGDRELEAELAGPRWFTLTEPGEADRLLELLPDNRVGSGSSREAILRWYVRGGELTFDGAEGSLPPLTRLHDGVWGTPVGAAPLGRPAGEGSRTMRLAPTPEAGRDALGMAALRVLERFAGEHPEPWLAEADAVVTLATLARAGDLTAALQRARSRWWDRPLVLDVIEQAGWRSGLSTSTGPRARPGHERLG